MWFPVLLLFLPLSSAISLSHTVFFLFYPSLLPSVFTQFSSNFQNMWKTFIGFEVHIAFLSMVFPKKVLCVCVYACASILFAYVYISISYSMFTHFMPYKIFFELWIVICLQQKPQFRAVFILYICVCVMCTPSFRVCLCPPKWTDQPDERCQTNEWKGETDTKSEKKETMYIFYLLLLTKSQRGRQFVLVTKASLC